MTAFFRLGVERPGPKVSAAQRTAIHAMGNVVIEALLAVNTRAETVILAESSLRPQAQAVARRTSSSC